MQSYWIRYKRTIPIFPHYCCLRSSVSDWRKETDYDGVYVRDDGCLHIYGGYRQKPGRNAALLLTGVLFSVISFLLSLHWMPHAVIR